MSVRQGKFISSQKRHNIVRTGIPSLDLILQGGYSVGSLVLIEENPETEISSVLSKAFLGEGAVNNDFIFHYSQDSENYTIPDIKRVGNSTIRGDATVRYETFPANSKITEPYAIDFTSVKYDYNNFYQVSVNCQENDFYHKFWTKIKNDLQESYQSVTDKLIRRIYIKSIFSTNWPKNSYSEIFEFLKSVKTLVLSKNAICVLSVPLKEIDGQLQELIVNSCDFVITGDKGTSQDKIVFYKSPRAYKIPANSSFNVLKIQGALVIQ